jgi:hypothetical protein
VIGRRRRHVVVLGRRRANISESTAQTAPGCRVDADGFGFVVRVLSLTVLWAAFLCLADRTGAVVDVDDVDLVVEVVVGGAVVGVVVATDGGVVPRADVPDVGAVAVAATLDGPDEPPPCSVVSARPTSSMATTPRVVPRTAAECFPGGGPSPPIHADHRRSCRTSSVITTYLYSSPGRRAVRAGRLRERRHRPLRPS